MSFVRPALALVSLTVLSALVGCGTTSGPGGSTDSLEPAPPRGEVSAQGTVIDDGSGPELCLGGVAESYPPQCSGIALEGWSWDGLDGSEASSGVTWGAYAVRGSYDGTTLTVTETPMLLSLHDPEPFADPTGGQPGDTDEATLADIQQRVHDTLGSGVLTSGSYNGRLWVSVVWDDGTLQDAADTEFGEDVVVVQSAMREVG